MLIAHAKNQESILIAMERTSLLIKSHYFLKCPKTQKRFYAPVVIVKTNLTATGPTNLETL